MNAAHRDLIFISYSHRDKQWLDRLQVFLKPYIRREQLNVWADPYIEVGDRWEREISTALQRTRVAVLLVSQHFFASDFIAEEELPPLLAATKEENVTLFCVPISASTYQDESLGGYQWAHDPEKPLDQLPEPQRNKALVEITKQLTKVAFVDREPRLPLPRVYVAAKEVELVPLATSDEGPFGELHGVPQQRPHFIHRDTDLDRLKGALLTDQYQAVGITGSAYKVGLHGMGGIGKTVLAVALVHDQALRRAFPTVSTGSPWASNPICNASRRSWQRQ